MRKFAFWILGVRFLAYYMCGHVLEFNVLDTPLIFISIYFLIEIFSLENNEAFFLSEKIKNYLKMNRDDQTWIIHISKCLFFCHWDQVTTFLSQSTFWGNQQSKTRIPF